MRALAVVTAVVGIAYWAAGAPLYNSPDSIDPWLYTALFTNFDYVYGAFWDTYYASRLPWIVPGLVVHELLPERAAYVVLHSAFFLAGAGAAFVLVRRSFGVVPAFVAYTTLVANQLYFNSQNSDYVDGALVTYLLLATACVLTDLRGWSRAVALFAAGFFLAAAVATNVFVIVLAGGIPLLYLARSTRAERELLRDALGFVAGAGTLLGAGCAFAWAHGADLFFLEPQIRAARAIEPTDYRTPNYDWVVNEPRLISPLLVLLLGLLLLPFAPRRTAAERDRWRLAVAMYAYLLFAVGFFVVYHVTGGSVLEYAFYGSLLLPSLIMGVGAVAYATCSITRATCSPRFFSVVVTCAAITPLLAIYLDDRAALVGVRGLQVSLVLAALSVVSVISALRLGVRRRVPPALLAGLLAALVLGVNYSTAASKTVFVYGASSPLNGHAYDVGTDFVRFMQKNGFQRTTPYFWYRQADTPALTGIQSLYFYGYTYLGVEMPTIDDDFRRRELVWRPRTIVLLCTLPSCHGGPAALRSHGYRLRETARTKLSSGPLVIWARVFRGERLRSR